MSLTALAPAAAANTAAPRASLENFACQRASTALDRSIEVTGVMRPMTGTQRMEMKFVLLRRPASGEQFQPVSGGDLGHWRQPTPATLGQRPSDVWRLRKVVANLSGPAVYRFRVTFRWEGASGTSLGHTTLFSGLCSQPQ